MPIRKKISVSDIKNSKYFIPNEEPTNKEDMCDYLFNIPFVVDKNNKEYNALLESFLI